VPWPQVNASRSAAEQCVAAIRARQADRAVELAGEVIRENPDFYLGHGLRGRALLMRGDKTGAKVAFERALELDPPYRQRRDEIKGLIEQCEH
jgi:Flp pilus assembly protein TadD